MHGQIIEDVALYTILLCLIFRLWYSVCNRYSMDVLHIMVMVIAVVVTTSRSSAIPQSEEHKSRVIDRVSIYEYFPSIDSANITCR